MHSLPPWLSSEVPYRTLVLGRTQSRPRSGRRDVKHQGASSPCATVHLWFKYKIRILDFKLESPESYSTAHSTVRKQSPPGEARSDWCIWGNVKLFHTDMSLEAILRAGNSFRNHTISREEGAKLHKYVFQPTKHCMKTQRPETLVSGEFQ